MGILDRITSTVQASLVPAIFTPRVTHVGTWDEWRSTILADLSNSTPSRLFAEQPHLRTVVSFVARNVAQLGVHTFERVNETDRRRDRSSLVARALAEVDGVMTTYELIYALVGDLALYDRAHWYVAPSSETRSGVMIRRLPPSWVTPERSSAFAVESWRVSYGGKSVVIPAEQMLSFTGYSPTDPRAGSPTVESLRETLQEQIEAARYRGQVWKRGGRVSAVLERPKDAPEWSDAAREAFREDWYSKYTGRGSKAGGTPILEDGMKLNRVDFNAQEQQFVEAAKLSLVTVASAFHVNPTMIGQNDGANYSNVREFRKMLYGDTLGPLLAQIEARLNSFLLPMLGVDPERFYVEFNIGEKLQGNFEEQSAALQTATGRPWMTVNETRARMNLPKLDDGDGLVTPLNVLVGGQASPTDSGSQNVNPAKAKAVPAPARKERPERHDAKALEVLVAFFERQGRVVASAAGAGEDWWDEERWDRELSDDLLRLSLLTSETAARAALEGAGLDPDAYDVDRTLAYLRKAAGTNAAGINGLTRERVEAALSAGSPVGEVFEEATGQRAESAALSLTSFAAGFGSVESARQSSSGATKTWRVTSGNPRSSHAAMDGETVPVDELFSNSLMWPGAIGDPDEVAGCMCELDINY